jgi:hypothetical protein
MTIDDFMSLSEYLLGIPFSPPLPQIDALDRNLGQVYLNGLTITPAQQSAMTALLAAWTTIQGQSKDQWPTLVEQLLQSSDNGPLAQQVILAWYTGFHPWFPGQQPVPDPANYEQTLVWVLAQAHPMAVPLSFGYWQFQPPSGS